MKAIGKLLNSINQDTATRSGTANSDDPPTEMTPAAAEKQRAFWPSELKFPDVINLEAGIFLARVYNIFINKEIKYGLNIPLILPS